MASTRFATYSEHMNDPWSNLVETLAGHRRTLPSSWPARRVHRMMDDARPAPPTPKAPPPLRPMLVLRPLYR